MKKGYGQFCPVAKAAELLCERWTVLVVRELVAGSRHFNELRRGLPLMSPTLLSRRLKQLIEAGVVRRADDDGDTGAYELTQAGRELRPMVELMAVWGHRWVGTRFESHDLDAGLLMWDIRRSLLPERFPARRVVMEIRFSDAPHGTAHWWLVCEGGEVDLCREDPGHDVDLVIHTSVRTLTQIWLYQQTWEQAMRAGQLKALGDPLLKQTLADWLPGSPLVRPGVDSLQADPKVA